MASLTRVQRRLLTAEQVYGQLRSAIANGEFRPGQRLVEMDLSDQLGVSRTPVREALRLIEQDGLVVRGASGGVVVRKLAPDELKEVYECRAVLEGRAAYLASKSSDAGFISELTEIEVRRKTEMDSISQPELRDLTRLFDLATEFHAAILRRSTNGWLKRLNETLNVQIQLGRRWLVGEVAEGSVALGDYLRVVRETSRDHGRVIEHLRAGQAELAEVVMRDHVLSTGGDMGRLAKSLTTGDSGMRDV